MSCNCSVLKNLPALAGVLLLALVPPASAFSLDTGPGDNDGGGWSLFEQRPPEWDYQRLAGRFTLASAETLTSVQGWMNWDGGALGFAIYNDFQGLPGSALYSTTGQVAATVVNTPDWRGVGGLDWALQAGTYWLVFEDRPGPGNGSMPGGAPSPLEAYASGPGVAPGALWMQAPTLDFGVRINVAPEPPPPVPEPATLLLWALGGGALLARRRR